MNAPPNNEYPESEVRRRLSAAGFTYVHTEFLAHRDWWGVIAFATTTDYWKCFDVLESLMSDAEYAATVREIWTATNGLPPHEAERRLLKHGRMIDRNMWMTPEDRIAFGQLPEQITVYRGGRQGCETGWSWSLTRETAEHFAFGLCDEHDEAPRVIVCGVVSKHEIIALFTGNWEEQEVIVPGRIVSLSGGPPGAEGGG
jgi:hypothetical protein